METFLMITNIFCLIVWIFELIRIIIVKEVGFATSISAILICIMAFMGNILKFII